MKTWRPDNWINPYLQEDTEGNWVDSRCFEAGADAMLKALFKLASESPTGTFIIDSKTQYIYSEERGVKC